MFKRLKILIVVCVLILVAVVASVRFFVPAETIKLFFNPQFILGTTSQISGRILQANAYELEPSYLELLVVTDGGKQVRVILNSYTRFNLDDGVILSSLHDKRVHVQAKKRPLIFQGSGDEYFALEAQL